MFDELVWRTQSIPWARGLCFSPRPAGWGWLGCCPYHTGQLGLDRTRTAGSVCQPERTSTSHPATVYRHTARTSITTMTVTSDKHGSWIHFVLHNVIRWMISICAKCITGSSSLPAGSVYQSSHCSRLSGDGRGSFGRGLGSVQPDGCRTCWPHKDLSLFVATRCPSQPRETPAGAKHDTCNKQHEPQKSSNGIHSTFNMHYIKKMYEWQ